MLQSIISCRYYILKQMEAQPGGNAIESCLYVLGSNPHCYLRVSFIFELKLDKFIYKG